jgi:hypothetical protein
MKIACKNFLRPLIVEPNKYTVKDKKYRIIAITTTMSKFGPSGSLNDKNITLEHVRDVMPNISSEIFFEMKYISESIVENYLISRVGL